MSWDLTDARALYARSWARLVSRRHRPRVVAITGSVGTILLIILILIVLGALPLWPYSSGWGYYPSGGVGLLLLILIILLLTGRL